MRRKAYLEAAGIAGDKNGPLFRAFAGGRGAELSERPLRPTHVLRMVKRRARMAGLPEEICCHTFRATGITDYLANAEGQLAVSGAPRDAGCPRRSYPR